MEQGNQQPRAASSLRAIGLALLITVVVGAVAGALNGWAVGHWEDFILEQHERAHDVPGGIKRYTWLRTAHFALPMAFGGVVAMVLCNRLAKFSGWPVTIPLAAGATIAWACAQLVGGATGDRWDEVGSSVFLPAVLFVVVPMIKIAKDELG